MSSFFNFRTKQLDIPLHPKIDEPKVLIFFPLDQSLEILPHTVNNGRNLREADRKITRVWNSRLKQIFKTGST